MFPAVIDWGNSHRLYFSKYAPLYITLLLSLRKHPEHYNMPRQISALNDGKNQFVLFFIISKLSFYIYGIFNFLFQIDLFLLYQKYTLTVHSCSSHPLSALSSTLPVPAHVKMHADDLSPYKALLYR